MSMPVDTTLLIDRITYLASLVSDPRGVDTILDQLRVITSTSSRPSSKDIKSLQSIESELKDYLLYKERLRSFTKDGLEKNIERHFAAKDPVRRAKRIALKRIFITIACCGVITALPAVLGLMQGQVILAFFIFTLFFGLALVFQSVKKDLVAQLHESVNYLIAGTIGTGIFALNFPVIAESPYLNTLQFFHHGGFLELAIPVYIFYYLAFYYYAKQAGVAIPRALRPLGASITALLVAVFCIFVPHPVAVPDELYYDLALIGFAVSVYFSGVAAVLGFMIVPKTTARYSQITLFLAISMVLQTIGNGNFLVFVTYPSGDFFVNDQKGQILTGLLIMCALAVQYVAAYKSKVSLEE